MGTSQEMSCTHQNQRQVDDEKHCNLGRSQDVETDLLSKVQSLENELADALEANDMYKSQLKRWKQWFLLVMSVNMFSNPLVFVLCLSVTTFSRNQACSIQMLKAENNEPAFYSIYTPNTNYFCKLLLVSSLLSKELTTPLDTPMENDGYDRKVSSLEAELKDLQECYLQMSLKCAEVEAQREQLVMKLKSVNSGRKWFS
ncbi:hypothetical protein CISIN_1g042747mg [Citrus sinensis]|uniref:Uncharacterized protein n=1 Tax=Citrus sinensis TaxID=2711 RepID=A0A067DUG1_CITSI|nr:hypothetical protein CISIN_1g042747mg [Citrus sinensis]